ncbi:hypothetical protein ACU4GD_16635 [Cupriavidus basilensis]
MLALILIPTMLTALGVVRERGDGLHHQPLCLPRERGRIPDRQTASLRGAGHGQLPLRWWPWRSCCCRCR